MADPPALQFEDGVSEQCGTVFRTSNTASARSPSPWEDCTTEANVYSEVTPCPHEESQEAARAQAHGRKHARDRNGAGAPTRPHTKKGQWSEEEEMILACHHREVGNKWAAISKYLPLRSDNDVKNHWNSTLRSKSQQKHCTFLWLYAKDVEPVADSDLARQQCFEAAQRTYEQLRDGSSCAGSAAGPAATSLHVRAVRRGASSSALGPRALPSTPATRGPWSMTGNAGQYSLNPIYDTYTGGVDETEDSQCLSGEQMGSQQQLGATECGTSQCTRTGLEEALSEEQQYQGDCAAALATQMAGRARARDARGDHDGGMGSSGHGSGDAEGLLLMMPCGNNNGGDGSQEAEDDAVAMQAGPASGMVRAQSVTFQQQSSGGGAATHMVTMVQMQQQQPGSSGCCTWEMPVVDLSRGGHTSGASSGGVSGAMMGGQQWTQVPQGMWTGAPCPSPGLPVMMQQGVSLEDAIAMDLEDNSFDGLDVATFLRMRHPGGDQQTLVTCNSAGNNGANMEPYAFPAELMMQNGPVLSIQAPHPAPYNTVQFVTTATSRDPGSDGSSCLSNPASFGGMGGCTSATAGSGDPGNSFQAHQQMQPMQPMQSSGAMVGFMPVAATTTPDLLHMGFMHQHDGLHDELEEQQAGATNCNNNNNQFVDAGSMGACWTGGQSIASTSSNAFGVLGLSPRATSLSRRSHGISGVRRAARHSVDLPLHSYRGRNGGAAMGGSSTALFSQSSEHQKGSHAGARGVAPAMGSGRHHVHTGLRNEAMPLDPNDPGSGDGSTNPGMAMANRHSSPPDQLAVNSGNTTLMGQACNGNDGAQMDVPHTTAAPLPWVGLDASWSGCAGLAEMGEIRTASPFRMSWSVDGSGQSMGQVMMAQQQQHPYGRSNTQPMWTTLGSMDGYAGVGMISEECGGCVRMEPWEATTAGEHWSAPDMQQMAADAQQQDRRISKSTSSLALRPSEPIPNTAVPQPPAQNITFIGGSVQSSAAAQQQQQGAPAPRIIIHKLPTTSKWNTAVAAAKGWPTAPYSRRHH